jgi:hypothetical protein
MATLELAVSAIPVIISPVVAWALGRSRVTKESATIDYLNKRLDLLERVNKLQAQFQDGPMKELVEAELEESRTFLREPSKFMVATREVRAPSAQSRLGRFFLVGPAASTRQRIFKGLFYFFFGIAVLSLLLPLLLISDPTITPGELFPTVLFGSAFYFILALLCRRSAK